MAFGSSGRRCSSPSFAGVASGLLAAGLLAACGGGGKKTEPGPIVEGNGFAPATGPGDSLHHFPNAVGNQWVLDYTTVQNGLPDLGGVLTVTVAAPRIVMGVSATALAQVDSASAFGDAVDFYAVGPGGVTYLGNDDPADPITRFLVPYPEVLFPVALGNVAAITARDLPFGADPYGNPLKLDLTQSIDNAAFESLAVPAGWFPGALRQVTTIAGTVRDPALGLSIPISGTETRWLAPGVGLVRRSSAEQVDTETSSSLAELRGWVVDGVRHAVGSPTTALGGLAAGGSPLAGSPAVAGDGASFLVVARKAAGTVGSWLSSWVARPVGPDGAPLGDAVDLGAPTAAFDVVTPQRAAVAFDGAGYLVVQEREEDPGATGHLGSLVARRVSPQGAVVGAETTVAAATDAAPRASAPALAFGGTRYLLAFVRQRSDALFQVMGVFVSPATGQADGPEFPISSAPGYPSSPALAFDGTSYLVVWNQDPWLAQTHGVVAARVDGAGNVLDAGGIDVYVATSLGDRPAVAWDGASYLVLWSDMTNVHANRVSPAGALLDGSASSGGIAVTAAADGFRVSPTLAFFDGEYLAAWLSSPSPGVYRGLHGARISPAGAVLSPGSEGIPLVPGEFRRSPALAGSPGSALLAWLDFTGDSVGAVGIYPFAR